VRGNVDAGVGRDVIGVVVYEDLVVFPTWHDGRSRQHVRISAARSNPGRQTGAIPSRYARSLLRLV